MPNDDLDANDAVPDPHRPIDDLLDGRERVSRSAEALRRIKPDEARALMLKANGLSYEEIASELGWTYTKVNRCITEGRARFIRLYQEIEAGESCERFAPTLASLAAGTASAEALLELRPHIRNCSACRATVRDLHTTRLGRLAALWPIPALVAPLRWVTGRGAVEVSDIEPSHVERLGDLTPTDVPNLYDALSSADALPGVPSGRWLELKAQVYGWMHRLQGSDVVTTAQVTAGAGGGGRIATIGAIVGLCLSSVGAGTVCVVNALKSDPPRPHLKSQIERRSAAATASRQSSGGATGRENPHREPTRTLTTATQSSDERKAPPQHDRPLINQRPRQQPKVKEFEFEQSIQSRPTAAAAASGSARGSMPSSAFETAVQERDRSGSAGAEDLAANEFDP
jgi:hypothetical protein